MKLDEYLLMVRKQARRGLASEIQCTVHIDEECNVVASVSEKVCASVQVNIYSKVPGAHKIESGWIKYPQDKWGHEFGPERNESLM